MNDENSVPQFKFFNLNLLINLFMTDLLSEYEVLLLLLLLLENPNNWIMFLALVESG